MGQKLSHIAQLAMDVFYQDFKGASAFFTKEHFIRFCILADASLKQDEYALQVQINLRARRINAPITLNSDNYYTAKDVRVVADKATLPFSIMSFPGIGDTLSVSQVRPVGNCGNLMRITQAQRWMVCGDQTVVYWVPVCDGIEFINKGLCSFDTVDVTYIPTLNAGSILQESRGFRIVTMVSMLLKQIKDGTVIDKTNDQNPNTSPQTEMNKMVLESLGQR